MIRDTKLSWETLDRNGKVELLHKLEVYFQGSDQPLVFAESVIAMDDEPIEQVWKDTLSRRMTNRINWLNNRMHWTREQIEERLALPEN